MLAHRFGMGHAFDRGQLSYRRRGAECDLQCESAGELIECCDRVTVDQAALMHDLHPVADRFDLGKDMGGEYDRAALAQIADQGTDLADLDRIETDRGLVQDHDIRIMNDRLRDADALLVALGERAQQARADLGQPAALFRRGEGGLQARSRNTVQTRRQAQEFVDRQFPVERRMLGQVSDVALGAHRIAHEVDPADRYAACVRCQVPREHLHRGGLARAVRTEQSQNFTTAQCQIDFTHRLVGTERTRYLAGAHRRDCARLDLQSFKGMLVLSGEYT